MSPLKVLKEIFVEAKHTIAIRTWAILLRFKVRWSSTVLWGVGLSFLAVLAGPFLWALLLHGYHLAGQAVFTAPEETLAQIEKLAPQQFSANIRNLGLLAVGVVGAFLAIWRSILADRAHKLSEKGLIIDRFQKGAQMLESDKLSVRFAGIYALRELATSDPGETYIMVLDLLFDFVRERSKERIKIGSPVPGKANEDFSPIPPDLQKAIETASWLRKNVSGAVTRERVENWRPDLREANLSSVNLSSMYLSRANLSFANLSFANLTRVTLYSAELTRADLREANLDSAFLRNADLSAANLSKASLIFANLYCANLSSVNLGHANLKEALRRAVWAYDHRPPTDTPVDWTNDIAFRHEFMESWPKFVDRIMRERPELGWTKEEKIDDPIY